MTNNMITFKEYLDKRGITMPTGTVNGSWFAEHGIPIVVNCIACEETMIVINAIIDEDGYTLCRTCAGMEELREEYDQ